MEFSRCILNLYASSVTCMLDGKFLYAVSCFDFLEQPKEAPLLSPSRSGK